MKRFALIAALSLASMAHADTLTIYHPGLTETIGGTFQQLNINGSHYGNKNGGGVEMDVTSYGTEASFAPSFIGRAAKGGDLTEGIWAVSLNADDSNHYFQYNCDSMFHFAPNNESWLDLYCSN